MYEFYLNNIRLPVTPGKLSTKIQNNNKTITLINDGEINLIKTPGLSEITFECEIPLTENVIYAQYKNGKFKNAKYFLDQFEKLKVRATPFPFIVVRNQPSGEYIPLKGTGKTTKQTGRKSIPVKNALPVFFYTDIMVTLEDYEITEDAEKGFSIIVSINLKQYRDFGTKMLKVKKNKKTGSSTATVKKKRISTKVKPKTYTVKQGDCLWKIAKRFYGDSTQWTKIYNANKKKIKRKDLIYPGQTLTIP